MRISDQFVLRTIMDEYIIVPVGEAALQVNGIISTNGVGAFLWQLLQNDVTPDFLVNRLLDEYEVAAGKATADVNAFLDQLRAHNILES